MILFILRVIVFIVLFMAALIDIKSKEIPVWIPGLCAGISVICAFYELRLGEKEIIDAFIAVIPGLLLLLLSFVTREGIGFGDGIVLSCVGPGLGLYVTVMGVMFAFTLSSIVSVVIMVLRRGNRKSQIPFIPFLAIGMGVMAFAQV